MSECNCTFSDAWRCAVHAGRTDVVACDCSCHRRIKANAEAREIARQVETENGMSGKLTTELNNAQ